MAQINTLVQNTITKLFDGSLISSVELTTEITITVTTPGAYDPDTGTSVDTTTDYTVNAIVRRITNSDLAKTSKEVFELGDLVITIDQNDSGAPSSLSTKETLEYNGETYKIIDVNPRNIGSDGLMWVVQARRL